LESEPGNEGAEGQTEENEKDFSHENLFK
jgi:hypothetical protein